MNTHYDKPNVVVIGASAGGVKLIEKLLTAFEGLPLSVKENMSVVIVQHLSEASKSLMKEIIDRTSSGFQVRELFEDTKFEKNVCYLNQPGRYTTFENGEMHIKEFQEIDRKEPTFLINKCFSSFAKNMDYFHLVFGIILSGAGSDGALGLLDLKEAGGFCITQDPEEAEVNGMPQAVINRKAYHEILFLGEITQSIENIVLDDDLVPLFRKKEGGIDYEVVSDILSDAFKFHELNIKYYRFPSLVRGILRRMTKLGFEKGSVNNIIEYKKHYEANKASESFNLVHGLLISYTKFFRDPEVWVEVARSVIPRLLEEHFEGKNGNNKSELFKIWSVGCATGEEAYTLSLIVHEVCRIREIDPKKVKIFATDISEKNILKAQEGRYNLEHLTDIPAEYHNYLKKDKEAGTFSFTQEIKDTVTFSVHDILVMAPLSKISFISCRNLLIYIRSLYQQSVFENLSFGLKKGGRLILGQAERTTDDSLFKADFERIHLYESLGARRRFGFTTQRTLPSSLSPSAAFGGSLEGKQIGGGLGTSQPPNTGPAMASALEHVIKRGVLLRSDGLVIRFLGDCRSYFSFPKTGPSFQIEQLAIPELMPYLTASLASCLKTRKTVSIGKHEVELASGEPVEVYMTMEPFDSIDDVDTTYILLRIFEEGEMEKAESDKSIPSGDVLADRELVENLQDELSMTKKNLAEALEHHVVTGEELQVTNEELMSSNEELMASNEELKSLNEELQVINQNHTYNQENILKRFGLFNDVLAAKNTSFFIFDSDLNFLDASEGFLELSSLSERDFGRSLKDFTFFSSHFGDQFFKLKLNSIEKDKLVELDFKVGFNESEYNLAIFSNEINSENAKLKIVAILSKV